jgi:alginate O-acetyltransferase complex protein AlgJ
MRKPSFYSNLFSVFFLFVIFAPGIIMIPRFFRQGTIFPALPPLKITPMGGTLQRAVVSSTDKDTDEALPDRIKSDLSDFQKQFQDNFGSRGFLMELHANVSMHLFNTANSPQVILGNDNWLFYQGDNSIDGFRGVNPFSNSELEHFRQILENRRDRLRKQGIDYLVVLPPDKQSVYPERMPKQFTRIGPARLQQVSTYLKSHSDVNFVDLSGPLKNAKNQGEIYYPTDTHWSSLGAFIGYQAVVAQLKKDFPQINPLSLSSYTVQYRPRTIGDLGTMIGLRYYYQDLTVDFKALYPQAHNVEGSEWGYNDHEIKSKGLSFTASPHGEVPRVIIFHDSFMEAMTPFLAQHFQRAVYVWNGNHDQALIDREKPNLVIDEFLERFLQQYTKK